MQRKKLDGTPCPIARSLERVGEWWSILILRDAFYGLTRFDEFEKSLGIAPNMLTRRLGTLVEEGLLEKRLYQQKPRRYGYHLTQAGLDFRPVLMAFAAWGNKHFAPEGHSVDIIDTDTGRPAEPIMVDAHTLKPLTSATHMMAPGPAATAEQRERLARYAKLRAERLNP